MSGCNNCRHYESVGDYIDGKYAPTRTCKDGRDTEIHKWWVDNAKIPVLKVSSMDCYEATDHSKMLDDMLALTDKALKILSDEN